MLASAMGSWPRPGKLVKALALSVQVLSLVMEQRGVVWQILLLYRLLLVDHHDLCLLIHRRWLFLVPASVVVAVALVLLSWIRALNV